jgi:small redox-active disulfide protein 2
MAEATAPDRTSGGLMKIQVVGSGCPKCHAVEQNVINACAELQLNADISHVRDITQFAKLGIMFTPGLVVDGTVLFSGKVPSVEEIKAALAQRARA